MLYSLHKRSIKDKLLKGGAWALCGKIITALSGIAISVLLARLLTPEEMGVYFLTFSLVSFFTIIAQFGMTQTIVKLIAESMGRGRPGRALRSVILILRIVTISTLAVVCVLVFGVGQWIAGYIFSSEAMIRVIGMAAVWGVVITFQQLISEIYRGFHDIRLATIFGGLITSIFTMMFFLVLWVVQERGDLDQILILTIGAGLSSVLISSALLWDKLRLLPSEEVDVKWLEVLRISGPLWVTSILLFVLVQADLWVMGAFSSSDEVAIYGAAIRLVAIVVVPLMIVNAIVPPLIAEMNAQGELKELETILRAVATVTGLPSLFFLLGLMLFGNSIMGLVFGEYYQSGGGILAVLCIGQLANVWAGSCGLVLMLTNYQSDMMMISSVCGLLTVLLAFFLVSGYGGIGVAVAASAGMVLQNIFMLMLVKKRLGIWTHVNLMLVQKLKGIL